LGQSYLACRRHPSTPATALCVSCAAPVCEACDRRLGNLHYCPECFSFLASWPSAVSVPRPEPTDEREKRWWRADWSLKEVTLSILLIFGIYAALGAALVPLFGDFFLSQSICYAVVFCPLIALTAWQLVRRSGRSWKELGFQIRSKGRTFFFGGLGTLTALACSYGAAYLIMFLFRLIFGRMPVSGESEKIKSMGGGALTLFVVITVLLAPIFEELLFRGLFYPALRRRFGPTKAILLNGMVFGSLHFQPLFMLSLILVGMVLCYLYEKTDSLLTPMLTHAFYNAAVLAITLLLS